MQSCDETEKTGASWKWKAVGVVMLIVVITGIVLVDLFVLDGVTLVNPSGGAYIP